MKNKEMNKTVKKKRITDKIRKVKMNTEKRYENRKNKNGNKVL